MPVEAPGKPASSRGLIGSVLADAQRLIALEIALAKQEVKELATGKAVAAGLMAVRGLPPVPRLPGRRPVLVVMLVPWKWEAAAIWVAAYLIVGLVLIVIGKARLQVKLPPRTMESMKENKEWALRRVKSNGR